MKREKKEQILTPEQLEKQAAKDAKQLEKLRKMKAKKKPAGYLVYFIFLIAIIYMADETATSISNLMKSVVATEIFAPVVGADVAVARMSTYSLVAAIAVIGAIFYRPLSDRYGRKPFLVINTIGMGIGMVIIGSAETIAQYLFGYVIIKFVIPNDVQTVYIYESAPSKHRAKIYSIIKAFATLGITLIPLLRNYYIPGSDLSRWRSVYMVPGLAIVVIAVAAWFLMRESDAYIDNTIRMLTMTPEEKAAAKERKADKQGGLINGFRYVFKHKQLIYIGIVFGLIGGGSMITSYYEVNLLQGYAKQFVEAGQTLLDAKLSANSLVTDALLLFPIGSAVIQGVQGFVSDGLGRKWSAVIMTGFSITTFLLCNIGASMNWNPYVVGFITGASVGSYWAIGDIVALMRAEMVPTNLRQSVYTPSSIMGLPFQVITKVPFLILMNVMGDHSIPTLTMAIGTVSMGIAMVILMIKVKETKGVDLGAVSLTE